ncbi:MAG: hypothetical protein GX032_02105 [Tenericutes bacterium]|nr:hypothetical protein [Mycoplasmatota bacterium]
MKINYDLMDKVITANNKINHKKNLLFELKNAHKALLITYLITRIFGDSNKIVLKEGMFITLGIVSLRLLLNTLNQYKKLNMNENSEDAKYDLYFLVDNINKTFNESIDSQSIEKAKVEKVRYKPIIINGLPALKQNKYISVPSYSELNNFGTTSILQEHVLSSYEYELTINKKKNH